MANLANEKFTFCPSNLLVYCIIIQKKTLQVYYVDTISINFILYCYILMNGACKQGIHSLPFQFISILYYPTDKHNFLRKRKDPFRQINLIV